VLHGTSHEIQCVLQADYRFKCNMHAGVGLHGLHVTTDATVYVHSGVIEALKLGQLQQLGCILPALSALNVSWLSASYTSPGPMTLQGCEGYLDPSLLSALLNDMISMYRVAVPLVFANAAGTQVRDLINEQVWSMLHTHAMPCTEPPSGSSLVDWRTSRIAQLVNTADPMLSATLNTLIKKALPEGAVRRHSEPSGPPLFSLALVGPYGPIELNVTAVEVSGLGSLANVSLMGTDRSDPFLLRNGFVMGVGSPFGVGLAVIVRWTAADGTAQIEALNMSTNMSAVTLSTSMELEMDAGRMTNFKVEELAHGPERMECAASAARGINVSRFNVEVGDVSVELDGRPVELPAALKAKGLSLAQLVNGVLALGQGPARGVLNKFLAKHLADAPTVCASGTAMPTAAPMTASPADEPANPAANGAPAWVYATMVVVALGAVLGAAMWVDRGRGNYPPHEPMLGDVLDRRQSLARTSLKGLRFSVASQYKIAYSVAIPSAVVVSIALRTWSLVVVVLHLRARLTVNGAVVAEEVLLDFTFGTMVSSFWAGGAQVT
jgi:hypothetical protein